jgi:hypothetical protein
MTHLSRSKVRVLNILIIGDGPLCTNYSMWTREPDVTDIIRDPFPYWSQLMDTVRTTVDN